MTINQFAKKYKLSYEQAFNTTYGLTPRQSRTGKNEYNETEMCNNLLKRVNRSKAMAEMKLAWCNAVIERVNACVRPDGKGNE
ncbi:MAG: hypothetical protein J6Y60_03325 [Treponema sp.]|nr:hypothetical protein [Treponema sp.]